MGTNRDRARPTKKFHRAADDKKRRKVLGATTASVLDKPDRIPKQHLPLQAMFPQPGMTYLSNIDLHLSAQQDPTLATALATGAPDMDLTAALLNDRCTQLFKEAVAVLGQTKSELRSNINPISLITSLRTRPALQPWAAAIDRKPFVTLFLVLRAARNAFIIDNVCKPSESSTSTNKLQPQPHDTLPRAIDAFHDVARFDWGGCDIVKWVAQSHVRSVFALPRPPVVNRDAEGDAVMGDGPSRVDDEMMGLFRQMVETSLRLFGAVVKEEVLSKMLGDVIKRHQHGRDQAAAARKKRREALRKGC